MCEDKLIWEDVAPYVVCLRQPYELGRQRAERIAEFIRRTLSCVYVEVLLRGEHGPGSEYGSCSRLFVFFDEEWQPIGKGRERRRYSISLAVSERGPFIAARGSEWSMQRQPWEGGIVELGPESSDEAAARAKALAAKVADKFGFKYVDVNWLREIELNPKELPWDDVLQSLDIDTYEPTALNILFDEEM